MMNIEEKKLEAVKFLKKNFNEISTGDVYGESILPIANGIVVYFKWDKCDFTINLYDHQHSECIAIGVHTGLKRNNDVVINHLLNGIEYFYNSYITECEQKHSPIYLPGCEPLYWDNTKGKYFYFANGKQVWLDYVYDYTKLQSSNGKFWLGE